MAPPPAAACRIYAILARDGRSAVVLRRGPSRRVALVRWWLASDTFEVGQWLKGRIYERRCDLSPDGELLAYFAASWKQPLASWTAVSRPPYLTALALWPKGDAWGGGGLFLDRRTLGLNHKHREMALAAGFTLPRKLKVVPLAEWAGHGEDNPIWHERMTRTGWSLTVRGQAGPYSRTARAHWRLDPPETYERPWPGDRRKAATGPVRLRLELKAIGVRDGAWYEEDYSLIDADGRVLRRMPGATWADWQSTGDLLFALDGRLYRLPARRVLDPAGDPRAGTFELIDLRALAFAERQAPPEALRW